MNPPSTALKRFTLAVVAPAAIGLLGLASTANAVPITYTFSGVGTSFFNGTKYDNELVTLTLTADTDGLLLSNEGTHADDLGTQYVYNPGITTVRIRELTDTILDFPTHVDTTGSRTSIIIGPDGIEESGFVPIVALLGSSGIGMMAAANDAFHTYDLVSSFAPLTTAGSATTYGELPEEAFNLTASGGVFLWLVAPTTVTFSAVTAAKVPEPSILVLLGIGLGLLVGRQVWRHSIAKAAA